MPSLKRKSDEPDETILEEAAESTLSDVGKGKSKQKKSKRVEFNGEKTNGEHSVLEASQSQKADINVPKMPSVKRKSDEPDETILEEAADSTLSDIDKGKRKAKKSKHVEFNGEKTNGEHSILEASQSQKADINVPDEAEAGIVEKISVTNFMCHKRLEVSLGANVNFIIGRNGSGKSAILTGIIVGLGGKANATSRGNSLKGFIKEGCSSATILITLRNRGCDAYRPEEYGDKIIVERRLSVDGSGSYKIRSADNRVISTKKEELIEVLDQFNIQIDNPVSILTQETARSFLNTSNEKDKYLFFLKATQLEQMSSDYQLTIEEKERTKEMLRRKRQVIPDLFEQVKINQEKYKDMQQLQIMESNIQELKKDLAWALVVAKKIEVDKAKEVEDTCTAKIPSYEKHVADTLIREKEIQESFTRKAEELKTFSDEVQVLVNEKKELSINYKSMRKTAMQAQEQFKRFQRDIHSIEKDRQCLVSKIEEIKNSVQRDRELERIERENQLAEKNNLRQQYENQLSTSNHHLRQIDMAVKRNQEQKYKLQNKMRDIQRQIEAVRKRIASLQASEKNRLSQYGQYTDSVLKAIDAADRQKKFHKKPVGPIGSFIKIKDYKWALAVEKCIKGTMRAYACHDNHDMMLLKSIFKRTVQQQPPPIIVCSFADQLYDTARLRPKSNVPLTTVMEVLTIENHIAANTLIDQCSIDTILLVAETEAAQKLMWNNCPRGAYKAISIEGHEIIGGRSSKLYSNNDRNIRYLQRDVAASIRTAEAELVTVHGEQTELQKLIASIDGEIKRDRSEYDKTRRKCSHEQDQINNVMMEIKELESVEEEKLPDVDALEYEVEECDQRITQLNNDLVEAESNSSIKIQETKEVGIRMKESDERCQLAVEKLETLQDESTALENELVTTKGHKKHYKNKMSELLAITKTARKHYEEVMKEYEETHSQATAYCEERTPSKSAKSLESEIVKAQKRVAAEEDSKGNLAEVSDKYHKALEQYDKAKREIDNCVKFRKAIDKAVKRRAKRYADFQKFIVIRAVRFFQMLLSQRGYTGVLKFDHENETLTVQVNVEKSQGTSTKDSKALSGGERSFSTICFIMALWEAMEAPFRCLDEFDVFMDMLNRRISMNMLMKIAKEQISRQFILLTPQDMSNVQGSDRVRIFKLAEPERGQQTITFQPT